MWIVSLLDNPRPHLNWIKRLHKTIIKQTYITKQKEKGVAAYIDMEYYEQQIEQKNIKRMKPQDIDYHPSDRH